MKRKEVKELHSKGIPDLRAEIIKKQQDFAKTKVELYAGKIKDTQIMNKLRHDLARLKTVLLEKELA